MKLRDRLEPQNYEQRLQEVRKERAAEATGRTVVRNPREESAFRQDQGISGPSRLVFDSRRRFA
jgi:hypothetical protein